MPRPASRPLPAAPPDAVAGATPQPLRRVAPAIAAAALAALLLGSPMLVDWAGELPIGPVSDRILAAADAWNAAMERIGLDRLATLLRSVRD